MSQPTREVIELDHHSREHAADPVTAFRAIRTSKPVVWSDHHGGFWLVSTHAAVSEVLAAPETYSSAKVVYPDGTAQGGVTIPPLPGLPVNVPAEVDPPMWSEYRKMLARPFSKSSIDALRPQIADVATAFIDRIIESGRCDLVDDIANPYPATNIMMILGLPIREWRFFAQPFHGIVSHPDGSAELNEASRGLQRIVQRLMAELEERRVAPRGDVLSDIANARIAGQPIDAEAALNATSNVLGAGIDTTTSFLSTALFYLSEHPDLRAQLAADPKAIPLAVEEFMRFNAPTQGMARTATRDVTLGGQHIQAGDRLLLSYASANRDDAVFDNPDEFVPSRFPNQHYSFGGGIHKCLGIHLARVEIEILLREIFLRMPDFSVDVADSPKYDSLGVVHGHKRLPTTFTPSPRRGPAVMIDAG